MKVNDSNATEAVDKKVTTSGVPVRWLFLTWVNISECQHELQLHAGI